MPLWTPGIEHTLLWQQVSEANFSLCIWERELGVGAGDRHYYDDMVPSSVQ